MPTTDPTQPWLPPYTPTPQPANLKQWLKLVRLIWKAWRKGPNKPEQKTCERCGRQLEVIGFKGIDPVWGCQWCN